MYPVCMRQVFRAAVAEYNDYDNGIIRIKTNPWGKVKIPQADRTTKIAISPEECRVFFAAPLPESKMIDPLPEIGRDVSKMVLCLINTVELFEMRKENYRNGCLCNNRAKTKKMRTDDAYIEMRVEPVIQQLMEKYLAEPNDSYLFRFHKMFCDSDSFSAGVNNGIKQICKSLGIPKEKQYKAYTFRHIWGTVAQNGCVATIDEVAFAMNHSHGRTITRGYIKLDFSPAWKLNAKVIDLVGRTQPTKRPLHWVAIKLDKKSPIVVLEVDENKDNVEIVGWYILDTRNLNRIKRQAEKNGGDLVMLYPKDKVESLSTPLDGLSSDGKVTAKTSDKQEKGKKRVKPEQQVGDLFGGQLDEVAEKEVAERDGNSEIHRTFAMTVKNDMLSSLEMERMPQER